MSTYIPYATIVDGKPFVSFKLRTDRLELSEEDAAHEYMKQQLHNDSGKDFNFLDARAAAQQRFTSEDEVNTCNRYEEIANDVLEGLDNDIEDIVGQVNSCEELVEPEKVNSHSEENGDTAVHQVQ